METPPCQYILATCSVLELKVEYTSVMEMNSQPVVLIAMMFQWSVYVSNIKQLLGYFAYIHSSWYPMKFLYCYSSVNPEKFVAENNRVKNFRVKKFSLKLTIDENFQHQKLITLYIDYSIPKYFYFKVMCVRYLFFPL